MRTLTRNGERRAESSQRAARFQYVESWREDGARKGDFRLVAKCGFLDDSPRIEFMNNRRTQFEFGSLEGAQALKSLLAKARWRVISEFLPASPDSHRMTRVMNP
jgi:hypothetical protein